MAINKRVVLIGAGNVATHLGKAWSRIGCEVVQVYSRTEKSASDLATCIGVPFVTSLEAVCVDADIYVVAVKDAVLQELIPTLVKGREGALFVHTAGSMPISIWNGYASRHGVLYPMQTFSKAKDVDFASVPFFVEANDVAGLEVLKELAGLLSPRVYEATSAQRTYLHMAAVFACNFANHMYTLSACLLEKNGLPFDVMLPLIDETARKVHELHPYDAQTGPAVRCDKNVMDKHVAMLADEPCLQEIYRIISNSICRSGRSENLKE